AIALTSSQINISWDDNSNNEESFEIQRGFMAEGGGSISYYPTQFDFQIASHESNLGKMIWTTLEPTLESNTILFNDPALEPETEYFYRTRACNTVGCSKWSRQISIFTLPLPLAGSSLQLTPVSSTQIDLFWNNVAKETRYEIETEVTVGGPPITYWYKLATASVDVTAFSHTGLNPETEYKYRLRSCNTGGCSNWSSIVSELTFAPPPPVPDRPLNFTAQSIYLNKIELNWRDVAYETRYEIHRKQDEALYYSYSATSNVFQIAAIGRYTLLDIVNADDTSYIDNDSNLVLGARYRYRIRACNAGGCSNWSSPVAVIIPSPPITAPDQLTATAVAHNKIDLSWRERSRGTRYEIQRKQEIIQFRELELDNDFLLDSGLDNDFYIAQIYSYTLIDVVSATVTSYKDRTGLDPESQYRYRVRACNAGGCTSWSRSAAAITLTAPPPAPTNPPSELSATASSYNQVNLTWVDNSDNEDSFEIQRKRPGVFYYSAATSDFQIAGSGRYTLIDMVGENETTYRDINVSPETEYTYRVRACNRGGCSGWSDEVIVTTPFSPPPRPTNFRAVPKSTTEIRLSWRDVAKETRYEIDYSYSGGGTTITVSANTTSYNHTSLQPNEIYTYKIKACNAGGCSNFSNEITAETE
ncbi:fibronectin type III domain-containing protein, partial [Patescibacteria group bacterium]|nr:fibronectin type III domain-containing protein [Patescibacteria group bacterium]